MTCCAFPFESFKVNIYCQTKDNVRVEYWLWIVFALRLQSSQQNLGQIVNGDICILFCFFFFFVFLSFFFSDRFIRAFLSEPGVLFCFFFFFCRHFTTLHVAMRRAPFLNMRQKARRIDGECAALDQRYMLQLHSMTQEEM